MRPKKHEMTRSGDLFRARLDQIINMKHELAQLAGKIDWEFIDGEVAPLYSDKGRPGIETRPAPLAPASTTARARAIGADHSGGPLDSLGGHWQRTRRHEPRLPSARFL